MPPRTNTPHLRLHGDVTKPWERIMLASAMNGKQISPSRDRMRHCGRQCGYTNIKRKESRLKLAWAMIGRQRFASSKYSRINTTPIMANTGNSCTGPP